MKLIDHLKERGETVADFAKRTGEAESTIRKIVYGQRQPSLPLAVKISEFTGGAVTEADLVVQSAAA
jgi:transcriptional regulator with XRE-family HTH domain